MHKRELFCSFDMLVLQQSAKSWNFLSYVVENDRNAGLGLVLFSFQGKIINYETTSVRRHLALMNQCSIRILRVHKKVIIKSIGNSRKGEREDDFPLRVDRMIRQLQCDCISSRMATAFIMVWIYIPISMCIQTETQHESRYYIKLSPETLNSPESWKIQNAHNLSSYLENSTC